MQYLIKAHATMYKDVRFRSRLEARWACFFDLIGWEWEYEPIDLPAWTPDFRVSFHCGHSECPDKHHLLVEVKPFYSIDDFTGHPCMDYSYGEDWTTRQKIPADASAAFGVNPNVTWWEFVHGAGGGEETIESWVWPHNISLLWKKAGQIVQWREKE